MPGKKSVDRHLQKVNSIRAALKADSLGEVDSEDRSALDFLIIDLQSLPSQRRMEWATAAAAVVKAQIDSGAFLGGPVERLIVLGELATRELGEALEQALVDRAIKHAQDRAVVYSLLDLCGMAPSVSTIASDDQLKSQNRLLWLDLMIVRVPRVEDAQELILDAASTGDFSLDNFIQRSNEMRALGGTHLGDWLRKFRSKLNPTDHSRYDEFVDEAFGADAPVPGAYEERPSESARARRERTVVHVPKVAVACQGGGIHASFAVGVLTEILKEYEKKSSNWWA
jgi:hypothetical protein